MVSARLRGTFAASKLESERVKSSRSAKETRFDLNEKLPAAGSLKPREPFVARQVDDGLAFGGELCGESFELRRRGNFEQRAIAEGDSLPVHGAPNAASRQRLEPEHGGEGDLAFRCCAE